jgi:predicted metal-dependent HD superfamily phosphohydrolase
MRKIDKIVAVVEAHTSKARENDEDHSYYSMSEGLAVSVSLDTINALASDVRNVMREPIDIRSFYGESHRRYHTWRHIKDSLALLSEFAVILGLTPNQVHIISEALIWHDAKYDPAARFGMNELLSALLAYDHTNAATFEDRVEIVRLCLLTAGHKTATGDYLGEIMVGIDLAILGAEALRYDEYAVDNRSEYLMVYTGEQFDEGRKNFLKTMLAKDFIYANEIIRNRFETQARVNMIRELADLSKNAI